MTLCAGCNYPIPSWQHNGACKPVAEKVPVITNLVAKAIADSYSARVTEIRTNVPEIPTDVPKKRGRPGKWSSETERKAAYRARKQQ